MSTIVNPTTENRVRWTRADLSLLPDDGRRYEIIDGDLIVTRAPHWNHQQVTGRFFAALDQWSQTTGQGQATLNPGIIFTDEDNVIPDVVWASHERLAALLDAAGHLTGAPELVVEVLSPGEQNIQRDRQLKRKLYSQQGVQEYWIVDPALRQVQIFRRDRAMLTLVATLHPDDTLTSPCLPGFAYPLGAIWGP